LGRIAHPHDRFFRALMAHREAADALFRERLPRGLVRQLADDPPVAVRGSFVDPALRAAQSDGLFRLRLRTGAPLFVYCLVEHKSAPDPRVALQLLRYLARVWEHLESERKPGEKLPAVCRWWCTTAPGLGGSRPPSLTWCTRRWRSA
jgi:predicted transposase YdaD